MSQNGTGLLTGKLPPPTALSPGQIPPHLSDVMLNTTSPDRLNLTHIDQVISPVIGSPCILDFCLQLIMKSSREILGGHLEPEI